MPDTPTVLALAAATLGLAGVVGRFAEQWWLSRPVDAEPGLPPMYRVPRQRWWRRAWTPIGQGVAAQHTATKTLHAGVDSDGGIHVDVLPPQVGITFRVQPGQRPAFWPVRDDQTVTAKIEPDDA